MAIVLSADVERTLAQGMTPDGRDVAIDPSYSKLLGISIEEELKKAMMTYGCQPIILCSAPIRLPFRRLIANKYPQISIMSYNEISSNVKTKSVGFIKVAKNTV